MKITLKSLSLLLSALLTVSVSYSCRKSSDTEPVAEADVTPLTVTGRIGGADTKVTYTLESGKISQKWAVGDTIIGIDNASTPKTYTYVVSKVNSDGTASFTFVKGDSRYGTATDNPSDETTMYMIYAPGYAASNFISNKLTIDISTQDATTIDGDSASGLHIPAIMTATGTVSSGKLELTFANQLELLMITDPTLSGCAEGTSITSFTVSGDVNLPTTATFSASSGFTVGSDNGTVTKNCNLTTETGGTTTGTVLIALLPASSQNLIIKSSNSYADTIKSHTPTASSLLKVSGATFAPVLADVTLSKTSTTITAGSKDTLTYTVQPEGAAVASAVWSSSDEDVATVADGVVTGKGAGKACIIITVNDAFKDTCTVTVNADAVFSVSDTKKVKFTKGNLYWDGNDFHIEVNQTDYPSSWDTEHVGHFFWTTLTDYKSGTASYMPYASSYSRSSVSSYDKFWCGEDNKLSVDGKDSLYALSSAEWTYLLETRKDASTLYKYDVTVTNGGKSYNRCLIIAPDNYSGTALASITNWSLSNIDSLGLVCLPAAGYRSDSGGGRKPRHVCLSAADVRRAPSILTPNADGDYWSSTLRSVLFTPTAYYLFFSTSAWPANYTSSDYGCSVRLVSTASE